VPVDGRGPGHLRGRDQQMLRLRDSQSYPNGVVKLLYDVVD
jgi:hypothetical protein